MIKKINKYFSLHPTYNSVIHAVGGIGIGVLIASPIINPHPLRWGITLLAISLLGHIYAEMDK